MSEEAGVTSAPEVPDADIFFNCPKCGKSLSIDARGEGYVVTCPDCQSRVEVPPPDVAAQAMSTTLGDLRERVESLERLRALDRERFDEVAKEMALVQAALDRVVSLLNDALAPPASPEI